MFSKNIFVRVENDLKIIPSAKVSQLAPVKICVVNSDRNLLSCNVKKKKKKNSHVVVVINTMYIN